MESCSEESFAWTETSKDSIDSDSMAAEENDTIKSESKHAKKRKSKEISRASYNKSEEDEAKVNVKIEKDQITEHKSDASMKRKVVKSEPESECDVPKKKRKHKYSEVNGNANDSQQSYDESHLSLKVKQEEISAKKSKKKHKHLSIESEKAEDDEENAEEVKNRDISSEICEETVKHKKKKKKSKKRNNSEGHNEMEVDSKEDVIETVVNKSSSNSSTNRTENSFQDESGYEEISAIQCEGETNGHTISFNDSQTIAKDNKKKNDSLYKSTIVNQFKAANNNDHDASLKSENRTPRISDRIRFEDEDDSASEYIEEQENNHEKSSIKLNKYIKTRDDIKIVSQKLENNSILTADDEIWIVKCPKEIDIQSFCNTDLNLNGKCKIKVGGQTYDGTLEESVSDTIAALSIEHGKFDIANLPLCGTINFRKRIPKAHFHNDNIMVNNQTNFIPLPETKCRHPLFGSNYKKAIKVPSAVAGRLNAESEDVEETVKIDKKKKKKHKKDKKVMDDEEMALNSKCAMKTESDVSVEKSEKKKKKRKYVVDVDVVDGPAPKKAKRIKHDPESAEAWESEKAIEENLFNF